MRSTENTILITGGSSGIGFALAQQFAAARNHVIITGRDGHKLAAARDLLPQIEIVHADMLDPTMPARLAADYPNVNVLINNAGVQYNDALTDNATTIDRITTEIGTNFTGHVVLTQAFLPILMQHDSAAIVNVTSTLGIVPKQNAAVYCATKAAMHSFTQTLRWQLERTAVRVFEVLPPLVDTPMTAGRDTAKVAPDDVAREVMAGIAHDHFEMWIGRTKMLRLLHRVLPAAAVRMMRSS